MQYELNDFHAALISLQRAYQLAPDDYSIRRLLGRILLQVGQYSTAEVHLRWCAARQPEDPRLKSELTKAAFQNSLQSIHPANFTQVAP
jgi:Flp pilus assembly protein TadD